MIKIAYISVIRNDKDILKDNLIYYYNIGIRDFYIMLHLPDQKTYNIISDVKSLLNDAKINIQINNTDRHYHDEDCKKLTDAARVDGFEWVLGTDIDELLVLMRHKTIHEFIVEYYINNDYCSLHFRWFTYLPLGNIYEHAFNKMVFREPLPRKESKAFGRFNDKMAYVPGLHLISNSPLIIPVEPAIAYYAHFPNRNIEQYIEKYTIQKKNWLARYGSFPFAEAMDKDPDFLKKNWERMIKENNETIDKIFDPVII